MDTRYQITGWCYQSGTAFKINLVQNTLFKVNQKYISTSIGFKVLTIQRCILLVSRGALCYTIIILIYNLHPTNSAIRSFLIGISFFNEQISTLLMRNNLSMGAEGLSSIGRVINQCEVREFDMSYCNLTSEELKALAGSIGSSNAPVSSLLYLTLSLAFPMGN